MEIRAELVEFLERIAAAANSLQRKLSWLLGTGLACSGILAWQAFSPESTLWWNIVKCGFLMLPALLWLFVWSMLGQLREAPALASTLADREDSIFNNIKESGLSEAVSVRSIFSTLKAFRQEEGLSVVLDTIGNVSLLANPLFVIIALIMMVIMFFFILMTPFFLLG